MTSTRLAVLPVVLAGGSGTRLWPLSRATYPKQYLAMSGSGDETLFQQAVLRLAALADAELAIAPTLVITHEEHRFTVIDQLRGAGCEPGRVVLEPAGRNTAPALALAALAASAGGDDPILVVAPADHAVRDGQAFTAALKRAVHQAATGSLVVLGIPPERPETGYGYIHVDPSAKATTAGALRVDAFTEKPDRARAEAYLADGGYFWNSGMFVLRASRWLDALRRWRPDIEEATRAAWDKAAADGVFLRPDAALWRRVPAESIDYAVMEPACAPGSGIEVQMVELAAGWSDLGAWEAVWQTAERDAAGNAVRGDVMLSGARNTLVHATSRLVGVIGVEDLTVVETADAVLVARSSSTGEVKEMVAALEKTGRPEATTHRRVHRPWGWYESIDAGPRFQVKRIMVKPGARLSLQMHHHRAEHWVVVTGTAEVTNGEQVSILTENQSTYIPLGQTHRLANPGKVALELIEVQSGAYLGEDDIVRFEDHYGRQ